MRVDEDEAYLLGISAYDVCDFFGSLYGYEDTGIHLLHYQVPIPTTPGVGYYIIVQGTQTSNFTGFVNMSSSLGTCNECYEIQQGFCTMANTCVCRYGWTGVNCDEVDVGTNPLNLTSNASFPVAVQNGTWDTTGFEVIIPPLLPSGYNMIISLTSTLNTLLLSIGDDELPNIYSDYNVLQIGEGGTFYTVEDPSCVTKVPTQKYFILATIDNLAGSGSINATLVNAFVPSDGTVVTVSIPNAVYYPLYSTLPSDCADYYKITLTPVYPTDIAFGYAGASSDCYLEYVLTSDINGTFSAIIPVSDCSLYIDLYTYVFGQALNQVNVSIAPTLGCPNFC